MRLPQSGWNGCLFIGSLFAAYFSRCLRWRLSYVAFPRFIWGWFTNKAHRKSRGISYSGKSLRSHFCLYVNIFSSLSQLCDLLRCDIESLSCFTQPADQSISVPCGQFFQVYVRTLGLEGANGFDGVLPLVWLFSPSAGLLFSSWSVSTDDLLHNRTCS